MRLSLIPMHAIARSFPVRKLSTRLIHWWETHKRYPIRERVFLLPPLPVNPNPVNILAVLTTPTTICDAAWAAQSLLRHLPSELGLTIVVDGELPVTTIKRLKSLFPGIILDSTHNLLAELRSTAPNTAQLGNYHPMGRKLATIFNLQQKYNLLYSDADVLCFREMPEVYQALITNSGSGLYIQDIEGVQIEPVIFTQVQSLGIDYAPTINVGFLFITQNSLAIGIAEQLLNGLGDTITSWFPDTMILSVLMQQAKSEPLPKSRYVVSNQRQFYFEEDVCYEKIVLRHFVSPVRHLMYSKGMTRLWQQWQQEKTARQGVL